jgi:hypothetical protein
MQAFASAHGLLNELIAGRTRGLASRAELAAYHAGKHGTPACAAYSYAIAAFAHLREGEIESALSCSEAALALRDELGGVDEGEVEIFLARARALEQAGMADEAATVATRADERMEELAGRIADENWRARFRTSVDAAVLAVSEIEPALRDERR